MSYDEAKVIVLNHVVPRVDEVRYNLSGYKLKVVKFSGKCVIVAPAHPWRGQWLGTVTIQVWLAFWAGA